ncbi:glycosyltransferase [Zobellia barbeyronii]|uniref:Glycosyltransferase n=1 Tax=Zobellia barbeyronii TaxID=2748009 RepID=A0ABS5WJ00_9FLAO|nr:glycosyltransferase [Zobellia barbeyronii]MBT2163205.1 glycosyltransferase [Zobellia barbeyronii]
MPKKPKIAFIIPSLRAGGAERIMSFIASNLDTNKFAPHLIVIGHKNDIAYSIENIPVTFLEKNRVKIAIPSIISLIHKTQPDVVVSAIAHLNSAMALISILFPKVKFVARETIVRSAMLEITNSSKKSSWISKLTSKIQAKNLDAVICQSLDMQNDLINNFGYHKEKLFVINNPITNDFTPKHSQIKNREPQLITVGRLTKQKGYKRILKILKNYDGIFHYTIIGKGDEEESILSYIKNENLSDKITHIPFTKDVKSYLEKSDLYLQGSYVEGFPNALLESCSVGTPVLVFNALGGINEIVIEGKNGFIAADENDFTKKLKIALERKWDIEEVSKSVTERYSSNIILRKYEDFFLTLLAEKNN